MIAIKYTFLKENYGCRFYGMKLSWNFMARCTFHYQEIINISVHLKIIAFNSKMARVDYMRFSRRSEAFSVVEINTSFQF